MSQIAQNFLFKQSQLVPQEYNDDNQKNFGKWSKEQQKKYIAFLEFFKDDLKIRQKRKFFKIFKLMGQFLKTRDGIQCRSHHMKQLKRLKKVKNIINIHKKEYKGKQQAQYFSYLAMINKCYGQQIFLSSIKKPQIQKKDSSVQVELEDYEIPQIEDHPLMTICNADGKQFENNIQYYGLYLMPSIDIYSQNISMIPYITYRL